MPMHVDIFDTRRYLDRVMRTPNKIFDGRSNAFIELRDLTRIEQETHSTFHLLLSALTVASLRTLVASAFSFTPVSLSDPIAPTMEKKIGQRNDPIKSSVEVVVGRKFGGTDPLPQCGCRSCPRQGDATLRDGCRTLCEWNAGQMGVETPKDS